MYFVFNDRGTIRVNGRFEHGDTVVVFAEQEVFPGGSWMGHSFETLEDGRYDAKGKRVGDL